MVSGAIAVPLVGRLGGTASWSVSSEGRCAKFYTLTAAGKKKFAEEKANWRLFTNAVEQILHAA
jgi:DNA-binding PadR family transcriptional regulator